MDRNDLRADFIGLSVFWGFVLLSTINLGISHNAPVIERMGLLGLICGAIAFALSIIFNLTGIVSFRSAGMAMLILCFVFGVMGFVMAVIK